MGEKLEMVEPKKWCRSYSPGFSFWQIYPPIGNGDAGNPTLPGNVGQKKKKKVVSKQRTREEKA